MENDIEIPSSYNYIGVFLTFKCNLSCSYCINHHNKAYPKYKQLLGLEWIKGLNRLATREDLPITLQGGEPSLHPDFYQIINGINPTKHIDILTNIQFDIAEFMEKIDKDRLKRDAPYASIRVSYHLETMNLTPTLSKVKQMLDKGYHVGIWAVDHPRDKAMVRVAQEIAIREGIDFRLKEFLGVWEDKLYGTYLNKECMDGVGKEARCKPSELLIAPDGSIHACHYTLYNNKTSYAHILNSVVKVLNEHKSCSYMGLCQPCDTKVKFDRFQVKGHCAVGILPQSETIK